MKEEQFEHLGELLMIIPTKMCRNMDKRFVNTILKDISKDLAKHHFMIMKMLQKKDKFYVTEIAKYLGITKSQMTASVDKLLSLGYVERQADKNDRRKIFISLTKDGASITKKICGQIKIVFNEDIKLLSKKELDELEKGLIVLNKFCLL